MLLNNIPNILKFLIIRRSVSSAYTVDVQYMTVQEKYYRSSEKRVTNIKPSQQQITFGLPFFLSFTLKNK